MGEVEKVVIVGSGPAGFTAAIYTSRALLKPILIEGEEPGGQLMMTTEVENYPGFEHGIDGPKLMDVMRKQAQRFDTRFVTKNVTTVDLSQRPFKVCFEKGEVLTQTLIVATGARARLLGLPSEKKYMSRGVSACATCDGAFFREMDVGIVGGGDSAMEEALFLTRFARSVSVIHRRDSFRASKIMQERVLKHSKIRVLWNQGVDEVLGDGQIMNAVRLKNTVTGEAQEVPLSGLFVAIGHEPNTTLLNGQLDLTEKGYIKTQPPRTITSVDGVFACGDVQDSIFRQAVTAAGSGCAAAIEAERWLEDKGL